MFCKVLSSGRKQRETFYRLVDEKDFWLIYWVSGNSVGFDSSRKQDCLRKLLEKFYMVWSVSYGYINSSHSKKKLPRTYNAQGLSRMWIGYEPGLASKLLTGLLGDRSCPAVHTYTLGSLLEFGKHQWLHDCYQMLKNYRLAQKHIELLFCS